MVIMGARCVYQDVADQSLPGIVRGSNEYLTLRMNVVVYSFVEILSPRFSL